MPEQDKKLVAHMQTVAEREIKAKKTRLAGGDSGASKRDGGGDAEAGISKALRTFDAIMGGGLCSVAACLYEGGWGIGVHQCLVGQDRTLIWSCDPPIIL